MVLTLAQLFLLAPTLTLANPNAVGQTPIMGWSGMSQCPLFCI
jgi:hypothetical protein